MGFFQNKRVWITGASSGIGRALAIEAARRGAHLVLSARNEAELHRTAACCTGAASVWVEPFDLSEHDEIGHIVHGLLHKVGKIDILINNGGVGQRSLAAETSLEVDRQIMAVNYLGTVALTKAVLPSMRLHRQGSIAVVSSMLGKFGAPMGSSYAASKHALHGFFDSLRAELGDEPIYITLVCPGYVLTNISANALDANGQKQGAAHGATSKGMSPEACAQGVLKAIENGEEEVVLGGRAILMAHAKRLLPKFLINLLKRVRNLGR